MKLTRTLALVVASLALTSPFLSHAQTDQQMDAKFNKQVYMKMAKDGMISKADVMKMVSAKLDKMSKNGMISVDNLGILFSDLYAARN